MNDEDRFCREMLNKLRDRFEDADFRLTGEVAELRGELRALSRQIASLGKMIADPRIAKGRRKSGKSRDRPKE